MRADRTAWVCSEEARAALSRAEGEHVPGGPLAGPREQARPREVHAVVGFTPMPVAAGIDNNSNNSNDSI